MACIVLRHKHRHTHTHTRGAHITYLHFPPRVGRGARVLVGAGVVQHLSLDLDGLFGGVMGWFVWWGNRLACSYIFVDMNACRAAHTTHPQTHTHIDSKHLDPRTDLFFIGAEHGVEVGDQELGDRGVLSCVGLGVIDRLNGLVRVGLPDLLVGWLGGWL